MIEIYSKWIDHEEKIFCVINIMKIEGKNWVYYRLENTEKEPREFSCFEESFLSRFTPYTNE